MSDSPGWERIETILDELFELAPAERHPRLQEIAELDDEQRVRIARLLDADDPSSGGILDRGIGAIAGRLLEPDEADTAAGATIGPYRVVRELGRGGMGTVLLAERAEGDFRQLVALKLFRGEPDRGEIIERFRHERRILATLRHPNIAALYDGGATEAGIPYFAMEYVEGEPIDEYCDAHSLTVDERIDLLDAVCRAVQHAHRSLVVHRDLKPSNVLVTASGGVKLLDFGIAKVVEARSEDGDELTRQAERFLTPAYAAPEQILGEATSTATDVYSLGVLLCVLLTGYNPHGSTSRSAERVRAILQDEMPVPSEQAGRDGPGGSGEEIAGRRGLTPAGLRRKIRGDLDNILRKALQRQPDDRYDSVEDLRADLERYRSSWPVRARPATLGYRVQRFVRRHTVPVVAGATFLVSVFAFAVWMSVLYSRAHRAEATSAREAEKSQRVAGFLEELFELPDPDVSRGESVTARELLDLGAARIESELGDEPDVRASLQLTMARTYRNLGLLEEAESLGQAAVETRRALPGARGRELGLAMIELAVTQTDLRRLAEAEESARGGLAELQQVLPPNDSRLADAHGTLGLIHMLQTDHDEAERNLRRALEIHEVAPEPDAKAVAVAASDLATVYINQGRVEEAIPLLQQAIDAYGELGEERHPWVSYFHVNLGFARMAAGDLEAAEASFLTGLEIRTESYGEDHPDVGTLHTALADLYQRMERPADAERHSRRALATLRATLPADHLEVAWGMETLGGILLEQKRISEAAPLLEEAMEIAGKSVDPGNVFFGVLLENVAELREAQDRWDEAGALRERATATYEAAYGPEHRYVAARLEGLAANREHRGHFAEAEPLYRRVLSILESAETPDAERIERAHAGLGRVTAPR